MAEYILEIDGAILDVDSGEAVVKPEFKGILVRCKNCKWYDSSEELCLREGMVMDAEDFCSRGEQKDD